MLLVRSFDSGAGMLVQARVAGRDLQQLEADLVDDALLTELWRQVALLHRAGSPTASWSWPTAWSTGGPALAGRLRPVAGGPGQAALERDRAELLAGLTALVGRERAQRTAEATLV